MIGISGTVQIPGGRGRATLQCVWSINRIDQQLGRPLDINSAWRDPVTQERLYNEYRAYVNYQNGGPWAPRAPIALPPEQSVHCRGEAIDSDDGYSDYVVGVLNRNGWFHTVYRNGVLVEPWHFEYDYNRDDFRGGLPAGEEEDDMFSEEDRKMLREAHEAATWAKRRIGGSVNDMSLASAIEWVRTRIGGGIQDMNLHSVSQWIKSRLGGSVNEKTITEEIRDK
jgi:hypothetical protein